jgi:hypothetical protein
MSRFNIGDKVRIIYNSSYTDESQDHVGEVGTINDRSQVVPDVKLASGLIVTCSADELEHVVPGRGGAVAVLEAAAALRVANKRYAVAAEALSAARAALKAADAEFSKALTARAEAEGRLAQAAIQQENAQ